MSISALYILDTSGKTLISRNYRGAHEPEVINKFMVLMLEREEERSLTPVLQVGEVTFAFIKYRNLYLVSTTSGNANMSLVFALLYKIMQVMSDYFKEVEEESVRDNFVVMHELLDEILDFGYPQITESKILKEYITQKSKKLKKQQRIPPAVTNAVSWRSEGIKYKKNELFLDVVESVDLMANVNGVVLRMEIAGSVRMKTHLSGMPELRLGLNDKLLNEQNSYKNEKYVDLDEVKFHQCVRLCKFENDRNISFIPPDGEFELMSYRLNTYEKPPIWVNCVIEFYPNRQVEYTVKLTSHFKSRLTATNVEILIPVPCDVDSPVFKSAAGTVSYVPEINVIKWSIKSLPGFSEFFMTARFGLPSVASEDQERMPPVHVKFEIAYNTISGIHVNYLKIIEKSGYIALSWIQYITQNGDYQIRYREVLHGRNKNFQN